MSSLQGLDASTNQSQVEARYKPVLIDQIAATLLHLVSLAGDGDMAAIQPIVRQNWDLVDSAVQSARRTASRAVSAEQEALQSITRAPVESAAEAPSEMKAKCSEAMQSSPGGAAAMADTAAVNDACRHGCRGGLMGKLGFAVGRLKEALSASSLD